MNDSKKTYKAADQINRTKETSVTDKMKQIQAI